MDHPARPPFPDGLIQVAGVHDLEETRMLFDLGVDLVGIPLRLTVHTEDLGEREAARISQVFPDCCCLITYLDQVPDIVELARFLEIRYIQLHAPVDPAILPEIRDRLPGVLLIKSLVIGRGSLDELFTTMRACAEGVDAFITDTFDPGTRAEGATGLTHDWSISARLVQACPKPVILAGGLRPGNVAEAIRMVRPRGVDVHTGVEGPDGRKDPGLVRSFVRAARGLNRTG